MFKTLFIERIILKKSRLFIFVAIYILLSCNPVNIETGPVKEPVKESEKEQPEEEYPEEEFIQSFGAYKSVIILGVDGGGAFFNGYDTPKTDSIFRNGTSTVKARTAFPSISAQCWGSMLHGVPPQAHRLTNSIVGSNPYDPYSPYPSIFRIVRETYPSANLSSFCNWNPINIGIIENNIGVYKASAASDQAVTDLILQYLENNVPTLMFVQFDSVDGAGHSFGYGSREHLQTLSSVDKMIGQIYGTLKQKNLLDDALFIVTADHGGTPGGSHGGDTDAEMNIFLGVSGQTADTVNPIEDAEGQDVAAIAAYALGVEIPDSWTARVPSGIFKDVTGIERKDLNIPVSDFRKHNTLPTPDTSEMKNLLRGHKLIAYLPFDDDEKDAFGLTETALCGKQYYYNGYFGKGLDIEDGYITLKDVVFGTESFSIAFWMKAEHISDDPSIISNKDWRNGMNDGFVLSLRPGDVKFNAGCSNVGVRMDSEAMLPLDYDKGWVHVTLAVDRKKDIVKIYYDFKEEIQCSIPSALSDVPFDALELNIGQDGTARYPYSLPAQLDEFIIIGDLLTEEDIAAMKEYYE